ncbi:CCAAT/enhancer-binding protein zeta [Amborella trichopoda]|uniref:CCAAT-binding factor domain-containing protein n=1 Tax=Amborella trichopoda TaxID=13333 RepID=W1P138_AMBTC|nr:CCAAT/enhancer-binding protein zeta [Amborella trichopoda]ERN00655.1 hypothetical protein AMTR_s00106p00013240 [Amborella trichopoda]|eukprot:XP_006838086.1 CCAAT/enhancer-binding protein zeta [Amborella trichopoda]
MAISKLLTSEPKPKKTRKGEDIDQLRSEVTEFASKLGLGSAISSGFDDSDFRKTGPIKPSGSSPPSKSTKKNEIRASNSEEKRSSTASNSNQKANFSKKDKKPNGIRAFGEKSNRNNETVISREAMPPIKNKLPLMKPSSLSGQWYVDASKLESKIVKEGVGIGTKPSDELVKEKWEVGGRLMGQYVAEYEQASQKSGDMRMVATAQRSGTGADKVAAFTVLIQDNPIANMRAVDSLLAMVTSKVGKRHALTGIDALRELFLMSLLPDRKLKYFFQQPLNFLPDTKDGYSLLLFWYWEDCLKKRFERFVLALEEALKDVLSVLKDKALKTLFALLKNKPEQERRLLSALVNKLGDPERKAASNAGYQLTCLLSAHPNMKAVVIEEVDFFVFRPHVGLRARYHAVIFLNQVLLSNKGDGPKLAKRLIDIYFALFKVLISEVSEEKSDKDGNKSAKKSVKKDSKDGKPSFESPVEMDSRLLSALLTGVNRAFPYVSTDEADAIIEQQTPVLFKLVHSRNFNIGVQALMLLYQLLAKNQTVSDRFYRALYSALLVPACMKSSKTEMFLGLVFKAMKNDVNFRRVSAFSKRLLQVALQQPPQYACGCLLLLSEVLKARPPLWNTMLQNESGDEDFEHFEDVKEDGENVTESAQEDSENINSCARDIVTPDGIPTEKNAIESDGNSSDTENSEVPIQELHSDDDGNDSVEDDLLGAAVNSLPCFGKPSKVACPVGEPAQLPKTGCQSGGYNPWHREPAYCNADRTSWWELSALASHVHPSVATMAKTLLSGANIVYNGDPLNDLSLTAFLDKFVEKKPKPNKKAEGIWHGGSQIGPARKLVMNNRLIGPEILSLAEEDVPPEDLVFHRFYMTKSTSSSRKKLKKKKKDREEAGELFEVDNNGEEEDLEEEEDVEEVDEVEEVDGGDDSEDEEIDGLLEPEFGAQKSLTVSDGEYDYDKLDEVIMEEDDELIADDSDGNMDFPNDDGGDGGYSDGDDDSYVDEDDMEASQKVDRKGNKRKSGARSGASPFASLEEYDHLLNDGEEIGEETRPQKKMKKKNKKGLNGDEEMRRKSHKKKKGLNGSGEMRGESGLQKRKRKKGSDY